VTEGLRLRVGEAWAFRTRVEREAARRFERLAEAIRALDPDSPVVDMMRRAAGDEVRHAALCAGLSEAYGRPAADDAPDDQLGAREAILYEVVAACCITETESVATVATLLAEPAEPRIRAVLHEIARDEVTHSRMGWAHLAREAPRGVAFLSDWIPIMLAGTVEPELFAPNDAADAEPDAAELLRHGVLPRARKREIFVGTLEEVVFPGLEKLGVDAGPSRAWLAAASRKSV
jgi:rubrerythrin